MCEYLKGVADCLCEDADDHAPCLTCGASKSAYVHVGDIEPTVTIEDGDSAENVEFGGS